MLERVRAIREAQLAGRLSWRKTTNGWRLLDGRRRCGDLVPDAKHPGMWRSVLKGGCLIDTANVTWAKHAVFEVALHDLGLVCEDEMRRKREDQRFKIGHNTCKKEYQHFPHFFDYPGVKLGYPTGVAMSASPTLDSIGSKVTVGDVLPRKMFWRDKKGRGWHWEADELGEHRQFNRSGDLVARINERGGKWVLT